MAISIILLPTNNVEKYKKKPAQLERVLSVVSEIFESKIATFLQTRFNSASRIAAGYCMNTHQVIIDIPTINLATDSALQLMDYLAPILHNMYFAIPQPDFFPVFFFCRENFAIDLSLEQSASIEPLISIEDRIKIAPALPRCVS